MSVISYLAHIGSWDSSDTVVLHINNDSNMLTSTFYGGRYTTIAEAIAEIGESHLDPLVTVFTNDDYSTYFVKYGLTNVLSGSMGSSVDYYISNQKKIRVNYKSNYAQIILMIDDAAVYDATPPSKTAISLFSYTESNSSGYFDFHIYSTDTYEINMTWHPLTTSVIANFWKDIEPYVSDDDPYSPGGNSGEGGGTGTFSGTSDSIEFPNLPTLSAVSTGFITLFNPSIAQMQSLATYMWSDVFDIGLYKTLFADPMDCILGCSIVPVAVPNGGTKTVNVGNVSTGISMTVAASQYVEVDCGTLNVEEYWGSYLDYDPYTKAEIYLPYCGTHALQVDDIMGKAVHVKYHVDILSGACCAYVKCGSSVMYSFVGQCSSSIPISANDWTNVVNGALTIAASVGSLIATGGASAPMAVGAAAAVTGTIYGGGIKQNVEKSGSMGGTGGMLAVQTPYLILTRPRQALPKKQNTYTGYPSFITTKLSDLKGYTEIDSIRITGVPATDAELNELESILKSGVIF